MNTVTIKLDATRDEFKQEAITRLKILDLHPNVVKELETEDKIYKSERAKWNFILAYRRRKRNGKEI